MKSKKNLMIFIICYIAYTAIYIARLNMSMAAPALSEAKILTEAQIGLLGSVFSVIYSVGRLINGTIGDKVAPYKMICTGLIIAGIGNCIISYLPPFVGMLVLWGANAFAQSMLWSSVLCVLADVYDADVVKKKTSAMVTSVATGNILGIIINVWLVNKFGVGFAFLIPGIILIVTAPLVYFSIRKIKSSSSKATKHIPIFSLIRNKDVFAQLFPAMFHGVMKENISLWMSVYFVASFGINLAESSYYILFIPVLGFVGRSIYSSFFTLCKSNEHKVSILFFTMCAVCAVFLASGAKSMVMAAIALSVIYAGASVINTSILSIYPMRFAKSGNVASVSGVMDFATYMGGGISSAIYGIVIEKYGYSPMFCSWIVLSLISIIILTGIVKKEKN